MLDCALNHPAFRVRPFLGQIPWACSYDRGGRRFAITIYGDSPEQVLADHGNELAELAVDGELIASIPYDLGERAAMAQAYEDARIGPVSEGRT